MATRTVTVCDVCGGILDVGQRMKMSAVVGTSYDGHRNDEDAVSVDLCPEHYRVVGDVIDKVAGENAQGATSRCFDRSQAQAMMVLVVQHWGQALAGIASAGEAA